MFLQKSPSAGPAGQEPMDLLSALMRFEWGAYIVNGFDREK